LYWIALVSSVIVIDEYTFDFTHNLSYDIETNPYPYIAERIFDNCAGFVLFELLFLFGFVLVGQSEKKDTEGDHDGVDGDFSYF
jgi:hypothetical protein